MPSGRFELRFGGNVLLRSNLIACFEANFKDKADNGPRLVARHVELGEDKMVTCAIWSD